MKGFQDSSLTSRFQVEKPQLSIWIIKPLWEIQELQNMQPVTSMVEDIQMREGYLGASLVWRLNLEWTDNWTVRVDGECPVGEILRTHMFGTHRGYDGLYSLFISLTTSGRD